MANISNENNITAYIHCGKCIEEWHALPDGSKISPLDYSMTQSGFTEEGIPVWCVRHDCNVMHIGFEGRKHPANCTAKDVI